MGNDYDFRPCYAQDPGMIYSSLSYYSLPPLQPFHFSIYHTIYLNIQHIEETLRI